jgi:broad specificity phosphatase PhoE
MKITIIRHGKTDSNIKGFRQGSKTDLPLNEIGRKEVLSLRLKLEDSYNSVYSSPLKRAIQTARLLFPGSQIMINKLLLEYDFGELEGIPFSTPYDQFPQNTVEEYNGVKFLIPQKGETFKDVLTRCRQFLQFLKRNNLTTNKIAVVTHGTNFEILKALGEQLDWFTYLGRARDFEGFTQFEL